MKKNKGFFLLEVAIAILLIGIIVSSITNITKTSILITKYNNEKINRDIVINSLAAYLIKNKRLPKPDCEHNGIESSIENNSKFLIGKIPFKNLDILYSNCLDSDKQPMTYIVTNECTKTEKIFNNESNNILDTSDNNFEDSDCSYIVIKNSQCIDENICFAIIPSKIFKNNTIQTNNKIVISSNSKNVSALTKTTFLNYYCKLQKTVK